MFSALLSDTVYVWLQDVAFSFYVQCCCKLRWQTFWPRTNWIFLNRQTSQIFVHHLDSVACLQMCSLA